VADPEKPPFESVADRIEAGLRTQKVSPRVLLGRLSLIDDASRFSGQYQDPNYLPFYFHVGRALSPRRTMCFGLGIGLQMSCLLQGSPSSESAFCFQPPSSSFYSPRVALSNMNRSFQRRFPCSFSEGFPNDPRFVSENKGNFDLAILAEALPTDLMMDCLGSLLLLLSEGGHMVVDRLSDGKSHEVFLDFCKARGLPHRIFKTRYGSALAEKSFAFR